MLFTKGKPPIFVRYRYLTKDVIILHLELYSKGARDCPFLLPQTKCPHVVMPDFRVNAGLRDYSHAR